MPIPEVIRAATEPRGLGVSLLVRAGSKAYGIDTETSDDELRAIAAGCLTRHLFHQRAGGGRE